MELANVFRDRALITAHLIALPSITQEACKESFKLFQSYVDLILPTDGKSTIMKGMTLEEKMKISANLKELNKKLRKDHALAQAAKASPRIARPVRPKPLVKAKGK